MPDLRKVPRPIPLCVKCGGPKRHRKTTRGWYCPPCAVAYTKEYLRIKPPTADQLLARKAQNKAYQQAHPKEAAVASKKWARKNPDKVKIIVTRYKKGHRHVMRRNAAERRAREYGTVGAMSDAEWRAILRKFKHRCAECGIGEKECGRLERDHIIPIARGGTEYAFNYQPLCPPCNRKKHAAIKPGAQHSIFDQLNPADTSEKCLNRAWRARRNTTTV